MNLFSRILCIVAELTDPTHLEVLVDSFVLVLVMLDEVVLALERKAAALSLTLKVSLLVDAIVVALELEFRAKQTSADRAADFFFRSVNRLQMVL